MEKTSPLVSVIVPAYNCEKLVHRLMDSVLRQTYSRLELILVNDGSTDGTESVVMGYREALERKGILFHYLYQENRGQAAAINAGLKIYHGDYLMCSDSDDWLSDDCVEKKLNYLQKHPDKFFVVGKAVAVLEGKESTPVMTFQRKNTNDGWLFDDLFYEEDAFFAPGCYLIKSEAFRRAIPDQQIYESRGGQNWQLLLPVMYRYECGFLDDVLYYILVRTDSHFRSVTSYEKIMERTYVHQDILYHVLESIDMPGNEKMEYHRGLQEKYAHRRFWHAVEFADKKRMREEYTNYCKFAEPNIKMRIVNRVGGSSAFFKVYDSARKIRDVIRSRL